MQTRVDNFVGKLIVSTKYLFCRDNNHGKKLHSNDAKINIF